MSYNYKILLLKIMVTSKENISDINYIKKDTTMIEMINCIDD